MGLFSRKEKKENTWIAYQDMLGDKKLSVRVDTKFVDADYKNTFYVALPYGEQGTTDLPSKDFLKKVAVLEEAVIDAVNKTFQNHVVFLGTATFGGCSYITFASNYDIRWDDYIKSTISEKLMAGIYPNDNMGYYNKVLYPEFVRK